MLPTAPTAPTRCLNSLWSCRKSAGAVGSCNLRGRSYLDPTAQLSSWFCSTKDKTNPRAKHPETSLSIWRFVRHWLAVKFAPHLINGTLPLSACFVRLAFRLDFNYVRPNHFGGWLSHLSETTRHPRDMLASLSLSQKFVRAAHHPILFAFPVKTPTSLPRRVEQGFMVALHAEIGPTS